MFSDSSKSYFRKGVVGALLVAALAGFPRTVIAVPVTDIPTETNTGITAGTVSVNTGNNMSSHIAQYVQNAIKIMQDINEVISTMEIGYMVYQDISHFNTNGNFFGTLSEIMNMASLVSTMAGTTMQTTSDIASSVGNMMSGPNPMSFALGQNWQSDIQDLNEIGTLASMTGATANAIQMMSLMNSAGFIGKLQAAQASINVGLMSAGILNQYEQFRIQRAAIQDQRRVVKDTRQVIAKYQGDAEKRFGTIDQLFHQGCYGSIGLMASEPSYNPAGACYREMPLNLPSQPSPVPVAVSPLSPPIIPTVTPTAQAPAPAPMPQGAPNYAGYAASASSSSSSPALTQTPPSNQTPMGSSGSSGGSVTVSNGSSSVTVSH